VNVLPDVTDKYGHKFEQGMLTISDVGNDARYGASRSKSYIDGVMSAEAFPK